MQWWVSVEVWVAMWVKVHKWCSELVLYWIVHGEKKKDLGWLRKEIKKDKKGWLGRTKRLNGLRL